MLVNSIFSDFGRARGAGDGGRWLRRAEERADVDLPGRARHDLRCTTALRLGDRGSRGRLGVGGGGEGGSSAGVELKEATAPGGTAKSLSLPGESRAGIGGDRFRFPTRLLLLRLHTRHFGGRGVAFLALQKTADVGTVLCRKVKVFEEKKTALVLDLNSWVSILRCAHRETG